MKVRLLNNGGYDALSHIEFPVDVIAKPYNDDLADVDGSELIRIGATWLHESSLSFWIGSECEVIE